MENVLCFLEHLVEDIENITLLKTAFQKPTSLAVYLYNIHNNKLPDNIHNNEQIM